jgi:hypothetical protein
MHKRIAIFFYYMPDMPILILSSNYVSIAMIDATDTFREDRLGQS